MRRLETIIFIFLKEQVLAENILEKNKYATHMNLRAGARHLLHDALQRPVPKRRVPEGNVASRAHLLRLLRE